MTCQQRYPNCCGGVDTASLFPPPAAFPWMLSSVEPKSGGNQPRIPYLGTESRVGLVWGTPPSLVPNVPKVRVLDGGGMIHSLISKVNLYITLLRKWRHPGIATALVLSLFRDSSVSSSLLESSWRENALNFLWDRASDSFQTKLSWVLWGVPFTREAYAAFLHLCSLTHSLPLPPRLLQGGSSGPLKAERSAPRRAAERKKQAANQLWLWGSNILWP